jgi:ubiquinone/menaquinone biosynthesis C-methylase UbiE
VYELFVTIALSGRRRSLFRRVARLSAAAPGDRVLDVGGGTGYLARILAGAVSPGGSVVASTHP